VSADPTSVLDWEAAGRHLDVDGRSVFVLDLPATDGEEGPPVLVLHGFPSASFDYRHVLEPLRRQRRVLLFDFLGFGLSAKPDLRYSIELQADVAEAVVAAAGVDRVALLTHDMGDSVGGEVLARDLDGDLGFSIERRALTNGSIYIDMAQLSTGQQLLLALPDERNDAVGADDGVAFRGGLAGTFAPHRQPDDDELDAQWALMRREGGSSLLPRTIRYIEDRREREDRYTGAIERHPSPLGVVWGRLDPIAVHAMTDRLREARPEFDLVTLDDVGHYPMVEDPGAFAEAVLRFLAVDENRVD
jgi:pimeloyl-ACP methyl ester carboxylesterase